MLCDGVSEADLRRVLTTARASMTLPALGALERQRARRAWPARQAMAGPDCGLPAERGEREEMAPVPA